MSWGGIDTCPNLIRSNPPQVWKPTGLPWKCESIPPPAQLVIKARNQFGKSYVVKVFPDDKIGLIKKRIKELGGVAPTFQRLYIKNDGLTIKLDDGALVGSYAHIEKMMLSLFEES